MTKRSHGDATEAEDASAFSKRQKHTPKVSADELALLKTFSKELRDYLKVAKNTETAGQDSSLERLATLSKTVFPIFQGWQPQALSTHLAPSTPTEPTTSTSLSGHDRNTSKVLPSPWPSAGGITAIGCLTAWTPADIPNALYPPLPPIPDRDLERMAMTHRGTNNNMGANYETLEFLGDAFIYHISSELITQTFPRMPDGRKSQMREGLLRNANLSVYAVHYGLDKRANIPAEFFQDGRETSGGTKAADKARQKVNGDLFEAYVGALIRARPETDKNEKYDGIEVATLWLKVLWAGTLAKEIQREYAASKASKALDLPASSTANVAEPKESPVAGKSLTAKVRLAAAIVCKGVVIRYEDASGNSRKRDKFTDMPLFTVGVWVDAWGLSECLGHGTALSKKEAGEKAAERALDNGKHMKFYMAKKKEFLERQEAQRAGQ